MTMNLTNQGLDLSGLRIDRREPEGRPGRDWRRWPILVVMLVILTGGAISAAKMFLSHPLQVSVTQPLVTRTDPGGEVLTASGYVVSRHQARVGSKVLGRVSRMMADEGQRVRAGQVLAELDAGELPAQRGAVDVNLPDARRELERQQALMTRGLTAQTTLDAARTRVASLEAQARIIDAQLEQLKIRAPFAGTITLRNLELGETVSGNPFNNTGSTDRGFVLADLGDLEVEADVSETQIAQLRTGQAARVEVEALPGRTMPGRLRFIQPTANRQKATVTAKVRIQDPDPQVRPDMSAKVTFLRTADRPSTTVAAPRFFLSQDAVARRGSETGAWQARDGRARWMPIEVAPARAGQVEVLRGLGGGETVILKPPVKLRDGDRVKPRTEEP
jgi:HlyD family secretion protein